jgi:hypothetical protein
VHTDLQQLMSEHTEFSSKPVYSADGDFLSVFVRDSSCYAERVDDTLTIYKDDDTDELVGCKLKGIKTLLKKMDASGIMVQDEFRMTALFLGWVAANKLRAQDVDILRYLIDQFGNITARYSTLDDAFREHDGLRCSQ